MPKIPGNLGHAEIAAAYPNGYSPPTKVHLQELLPGGKAGHFFRELRHWSNISINRTIGGKGRAIISLNNANDQHFGNKAARQFKNPETEPMYKAYLRDLHRRTLPYLKEINPNRRRGINRDFQGLRAFDEATIADYVGFLYNFDGFDGGVAQGGGTQDLVALGLMQRVIIDAQGIDGRWYALFTGIVSSIEDSYQPGETPTINLICSDYWRLFDLSETIVRTGLDPIADNIQREFSTNRALKEAFQATSLAGLSGPKILQIVMDTVQRTMCWIPYAIWKDAKDLGKTAEFPNGRTVGLPVSPSGFYAVDLPNGQDSGASISERNFFNHEPFWYIPFSDSGVEPVADYEGLNNLRRYARPPALPAGAGSLSALGATQAAGQLAQSAGGLQAQLVGSAIPTAALAGALLPTALRLAGALEDGDEPKDGLPVGQLYATLLIDRYIEKGTQGIAYVDLIQSILGPWQTNVTLGSIVVQRVAASTFYDVLITSNGDVLYQIPKYNNCPAEYAPKGSAPIASDPLVAASTVAAGPSALASQLGGLTPAQVDAIGHDVNLSGIRPPSAFEQNPSIMLGIPSTAGKVTDNAADLLPGSKGKVYILPAISITAGPESTKPSIGVTDGEYDFAPPPEGFAQKHHGWNYALTDLSNYGWRFSSSDEGLVTTVRVPSGQGFIKLGELIDGNFFTGRTRLADTQAIVARFGLRALEAQKIFIDNIYDKVKSKDLLDAFAMALLIQINGRASVADLPLAFRPDLDEGKNVFHVERQRLLYVTGISHQIPFGQWASTTLQCSFGHDVSREIQSPFVAVRDLLTSASDTAAAEAKAEAATEANALVASNRAAVAGGTGIPGGPPVPGIPSAIGVPGALATQGVPSSQQPFRIATDAIDGMTEFRKSWNAASATPITPRTSPFVGTSQNGYIDRIPGEMLAEVLEKLRQIPGKENETLADHEYAIARAISSESGFGADILTDIIVVESKFNALVGKYKDKTGDRLRLHKTDSAKNGKYGTQPGRFASTAKDATLRGIVTVRAVFNRQVGPVIRGITNYISPETQLQNFKEFGVNFARPPIEAGEEFIKKYDVEWVGSVDGISAKKFIFFKPAKNGLAARNLSQNAMIAYLMQNGYTRMLPGPGSPVPPPKVP